MNPQVRPVSGVEIGKAIPNQGYVTPLISGSPPPGAGAGAKVTTKFFGGTMKPLYAAPALLLALAACSVLEPRDDVPASEEVSSTAAPPSVAATSVAMPAGPYELTTQSGAQISFTLPTPATDPAVAAIEAYRVKIGAAPVSYLVAEVDNRGGTAPVDLYAVSASDAEGRQFTFSTVADVIHSWGPTYSYDFKWRMGDGRAVDEAVGTELKREAGDLSNSTINKVDSAGRATIVLASTDVELPAKFADVTVQPSGMGGEEQARPANLFEGQRVQ